MLIRGFLVVAALASVGCSDDGRTNLRSFELHGETPAVGGPRDAPDLPQEWGSVAAVVVEAPEQVTAREDFEIELELRNPLQDPIELDPCPVWGAGFGESDDSTALDGLLPCEEIGRLQPGERIRLRLTMPSPPNVTSGEGGEFAGFAWRLEGEFFNDVRATVALPMKESG